MRTHRFAVLLRQLAELDRQRAELWLELAEELAGDAAATLEKPARARRQGTKILPPERAPSEVDIARARRALRRAGLVGVKGS